MSLQDSLKEMVKNYLSDKSAFTDNIFDTPQVRDANGRVVINYDPLLVHIETDEGPTIMVEATAMDIDDCNSRIRVLPESVYQIQGFLSQWVDSRGTIKVPKSDRLLEWGLKSVMKSMNADTLKKHDGLHKNGLRVFSV